MRHATHPEIAPDASSQPAALPAVRFESLLTLMSPSPSIRKARGTTFAVSVAAHLALIASVVVVPLLMDEAGPIPTDAVRAFFVSPPEIAAPPPPPPPPAAGVQAKPVERAAPRPEPASSTRFVAPMEIPTEIAPDRIDLGIEGGVPGGVEGGVPGGVVGGVVGGIPLPPPLPLPTTAAAPAVRVGGVIAAPKLLHRVNPAYPPLAQQARVSAVVILEAVVDTHGRIRDVKLLRGHPLFDVAAIEAVRQWQYQPLLLGGVPTDFVLTVTVVFNIRSVVPEG